MPFNDLQSQNYLATCLPKGRLTAQRFDNESNLFWLLYCIADFINQVTAQLFQLVYNIDINQIDVLLAEWETAVGIPSEIPRLTTTPQRIGAIMQLITKIPVYNIRNAQLTAPDATTIESYIFNLTGMNVVISVLNFSLLWTNKFPLLFPIVFGVPYNLLGFNLVVNIHIGYNAKNNYFPLPFPTIFFNSKVPQATQDLLDNILNKVIPSFMTWTYNAII